MELRRPVRASEKLKIFVNGRPSLIQFGVKWAQVILQEDVQGKSTMVRVWCPKWADAWWW